MMPSIDKLHHFAYRCRNAEETRAFYEDVLGLKLAHVIGADTVPSTGEYSPYFHIFFELGDGSYVAFFDLGDDKYTQGNPHPMIDPSVRDDAIIEALKDDSVAVILADVVIGYGAHYDPAGHLAGTITTHQSTCGPLVITSITGTDGDPQVRSVQMSKLEAVGILVAPTNADAASWALSAIQAKA